MCVRSDGIRTGITCPTWMNPTPCEGTAREKLQFVCGILQFVSNIYSLYVVFYSLYLIFTVCIQYLQFVFNIRQFVDDTRQLAVYRIQVKYMAV